MTMNPFATELKKELMQEAIDDVRTMWNNLNTPEQELVMRCLLADVPDAEIEAYGTDKQKEEAFDGDFDLDEEDIKASKNLVDSTFQRVYELDVKKLYWHMQGDQYVIVF